MILAGGQNNTLPEGDTSLALVPPSLGKVLPTQENADEL